MGFVNIHTILRWIGVVCSFWLAYLYYEHYFLVSAYGDLGCFMSLGECIANGKQLYLDVWDNKAPGVFLIHALAQSFQKRVGVDYPYLISAFFMIGTFIIGFLRNRSSNLASFWLIAAIWLIYRWTLTWEVFYVGAYTEEWASYFVLSSFLIALNDEKFWNGIISGILLGVAVFIKEPFVFFVLPFYGYWVFKGKLKFKALILWHLGLSIPWMVFFAVYSFHGNLYAVFNYFEGAFSYADANVNLFQKSWGRCTQLMDMLSTNYFQGKSIFWVFKSVFLYMMIRVIWGIVRRIMYREFHCRIPMITAAFLGMVSSILFLSLGPQFYYHYAIPFGIVFMISICILFWDFSQLIRVPNNELLGLLLLLFFLIQIPWALWGSSGQQLNKNAGFELINIQHRLAEDSEVFIDHEHGGRWYSYGGYKPWGKFPVPYYVYFYNEVDNHQPNLVRNRKEFRNSFLTDPPEHIITQSLTDSALVFRYTQLVGNVNEKYRCIDSFIAQPHSADEETLYILKRR